MKKLLALLFTVLSGQIFAQAPQSINYQTIVRDALGFHMPNQQMNFRISILEDNANGTVVYQETQKLGTNDFGLVSFQIGKGLVASGTFNTIDWGNHEYFIKTELDVSGGTNFVAMGTQQLVSVPYALYAEKAGTTLNDNDTDSTNELQNLSLNGDTLSISNGNNVVLNTSSPLSSTNAMLEYGEDINYGDAVILGDGLSGYANIQSGDDASNVANTGNLWIAQTFETTSRVKAIRGIYLSRCDIPPGNITFTAAIKATSGGVPTGSDIGVTSVTATLGAQETRDVAFSFNPPIIVQPNTTYAFILRGNFINVSAPAVGIYPGGQVYTSSDAGLNWSPQSTRDLFFYVYETETELGKVYKAQIRGYNNGMDPNEDGCFGNFACTPSATNLDLYSRFIGFALENGVAGETKSVGIGPVVQLPGGFNVGKDFYLSTNPGQILTTPTNPNIKVGTSISIDKLLIVR